MDLGDVSAEQLKGALAGQIEGRFEDLMGNSSGYLESLPKPVLRRVNALENIQDAVDKRMAEFEQAKRELMKKLYEDLEPFYDKRSSIILGTYEPTDEECKIEDDFTAEEEAEAAKQEATKEGGDDAGASSAETTTSSSSTSSDIKGIPGFWSTALRNHELFDDVITDQDAKALDYLIDLKCTPNFDNDKADGFSLEFFFSENPFFANKSIKKTYFMDYNEQFSMPMLDHTESTPIEWHIGKDLTTKTVRQKQSNSRGNRKTVTKKVPQESFFSFFSFPEVSRTMSEEQLEMINELVERDYLLGSTLKDRIIPNAIAWFTGEALIPDEFPDDQEFTEEELAALGIDLSDPKVLAQLMGGSMEGMMGGYEDMGGDDEDDEGEEECETQ
eukprot:TRINITY_DN4182_c0_g1_i6.p2 TRINITY_DN4182_c0_g1~~TRINITY_DN4182_c0_g1_i6.p2  ORF type:complete len:387 (-),score=170.28 TRINITY_DN4182_c0_g1_i6:1428-2588(-)